MRWRKASRLCALVALCLVLLGAIGAEAAEPRTIAEVGQTVGKGWRLVEIGPLVAANDAGQVAFLADIGKDGEVKVALMRNKKRMVWEGKRLDDGSVVTDIDRNACPSINEDGEVAVYARIGTKVALIGRDRPLVWVGKKVGGKTITSLNPRVCAPLDDRGRPAYVAWYETRASGPAIPRSCPANRCLVGVFVGDRAVLLAGAKLADGSVVERILDEVAMTASGRIVAPAQLDLGERALV
jgi:hypothetical protein